jgi:hypothetical protein
MVLFLTELVTERLPRILKPKEPCIGLAKTNCLNVGLFRIVLPRDVRNNLLY